MYNNRDTRNVWYHYFKKLFSNDEDHNDGYDERFEKRVKDSLSRIVRKSFESSDYSISDISLNISRGFIQRVGSPRHCC